MTVSSDEDDAGKPSKVGLKVSSGCVYYNCSCFLAVFIVLFWPRIRNVVRLRMLLGFLSLPGHLIMGLGMGELDGVLGWGGCL